MQAIALANSRTTAANYRAALNNLWGHLGLGDRFWSGFKLSSPHKAIKVLKFEDAELRKLLEKAEPKLQVAIRIARHTGAREGEIATFVYDAELDQIIIGKSKTEAGVRTIPCPKAIRNIVKMWVDDRWSKLTIRNRFWPAAGFTDTELRCFDGTGGFKWREGSSAASSSLRR